MRRIISSFILSFVVVASALAQSTPQLASTLAAIPQARGMLGHNGMVVAQERIAARIGVEILDRGGNAVDAAVAVGFALPSPIRAPAILAAAASW